MMAPRKRAEDKPVTYEELEQLIDRYVEQQRQRAFFLMMARRVTTEEKEQEKRPLSSGGRKGAR
jgi:hypothetical protein